MNHAWTMTDEMWFFTDDMDKIMEVEREGGRVEIDTTTEDLVIKINSEMQHTIPENLRGVLCHARRDYGPNVHVTAVPYLNSFSTNPSHGLPYYTKSSTGDADDDLKATLDELVTSGVHEIAFRGYLREQNKEDGWVESRSSNIIKWSPKEAKKRRNSVGYQETHRRRYGKIRIDDVKRGVYILYSMVHNIHGCLSVRYCTSNTEASMGAVERVYDVLGYLHNKEGERWFDLDSEKHAEWVQWLEKVQHYAIGLVEVQEGKIEQCFGKFLLARCEEEDVKVTSYRKTPKGGTS